MSNIRATVFIPTYNGERYIAEILKSIFNQSVDFDYEVLVIDSGSRDKTVEIVESYTKEYSNLVLHQISNKGFGHGKTRNLAAEMAKGEFVVYLTHDATPAHGRWLYEMIRPFEINKNIVGVMGKQIPRVHCFPLLKYEINHVFNNFGPDFGTTMFYKDDFIQDQAVYDAVGFYSDANSAARKDFLIGEIPYQNVSYAEDQLFGRDIINKGYYKAYAPRGSVVHSNDFSVSEYSKRMFDETLALRKTGISAGRLSGPAAIKLTARGIVGDSLRILKDPAFSWKRKIYWLAVNPFYHVQKWRGVYAALSVDLSNKETLKKNSLEYGKKHK